MFSLLTQQKCWSQPQLQRRTERQNPKCCCLSFLDRTIVGSEGAKEEKYINVQHILYFKTYYASSVSLPQHARLKYLGNQLEKLIFKNHAVTSNTQIIQIKIFLLKFLALLSQLSKKCIGTDLSREASSSTQLTFHAGFQLLSVRMPATLRFLLSVSTPAGKPNVKSVTVTPLNRIFS